MKFFYLVILIGVFSFISANEVALAKNFKGDVYVVRGDKELPIEVGTKIFENDVIITKSKSTVGLIFQDNTRMSIGQNSELVIEEYIFKPEQESFVTNLVKGTIECITGFISKINPDAVKIKAKTATIGIRGTHFIVKAD